MSDYETRAQTLGLANPEELKQAMLVENSVLLDVRSDEEIEQSGRFEKEGHKWVQSPCTRTECAMLSKSYEELFPDKKGKLM